MRLSAQLAQQSLLDLLPGYVLHMEHPALRVTALFAQVKLTMSRDFAFIKVQPEICQLADAFRTLGHNRADDRFVAQTRAGLKRIAHMQLK